MFDRPFEGATWVVPIRGGFVEVAPHGEVVSRGRSGEDWCGCGLFGRCRCWGFSVGAQVVRVFG